MSQKMGKKKPVRRDAMRNVAWLKGGVVRWS